MITAAVAYDKPRTPEGVKQKISKTFEEYWEYQKTHRQIKGDECAWYKFDTMFTYGHSAIYVDCNEGVWREETEREYVVRTGDLWG